MRQGVRGFLNLPNSSNSRRYFLVKDQMIPSLFKGLMMNIILERLSETTQVGRLKTPIQYLSACMTSNYDCQRTKS